MCGEPEEGVDDGGGGDVVKVAQLLRAHPGHRGRGRLDHRWFGGWVVGDPAAMATG